MGNKLHTSGFYLQLIFYMAHLRNVGILRTLLSRENRKAFVKTVLIVLKLDVGRIKVLMILIIFLSCASKYLSTFFWGTKAI